LVDVAVQVVVIRVRAGLVDQVRLPGQVLDDRLTAAGDVAQEVVPVGRAAGGPARQRVERGGETAEVVVKVLALIRAGCAEVDATVLVEVLPPVVVFLRTRPN
jgi:hypothetical protein